MNQIQSIEAFEQAKKVIPGGVNSPVRSFSAVGGTPPFIKAGKGAYITDIDDNRYIDFVLSWGPLILGHSDDEVIERVIATAKNSLSFGAPTLTETMLCEQIIEAYPFIDKVRLVSSGTEAVMSAIRLARGYSGKEDIIKFAGCYHGHSDSLLIKAGSGLATLSQPSSPGVPADFAKHTLLADYNSIESVERCFAASSTIAAVIIEPVAGNMGLVPADIEFLQQLQMLCQEYEALLIFDEVMSGFRVSYGGACELTGIEPDIVVWGKVIGGGMPMGAFGAKESIINHLSPLGVIYQAGTLSGNPISTIAGLTTLQKLKRLQPYAQLEQTAQQLTTGFGQIADQMGIDIVTVVRGSMFGFFFNKKVVRNFDDACQSSHKRFQAFHQGMLDRGIYLACSPYEAGFLSICHNEEIIQTTLQACEDTLKSI